MKTTAKFRASRRLRFADTKRIMSPEIRPKSFWTFEKQAAGEDIMVHSYDSIKRPSLCTTLLINHYGARPDSCA